MSRTVRTGLVFALAAGVVGAGLLWAPAAAAQNAAHNHIGHVMDKWNDTPDMAGLLPAAIAEARIAAAHAGFAARDLSDLDAMKLHAAHVLHAVDPSQIEGGPGPGLRRAPGRGRRREAHHGGRELGRRLGRGQGPRRARLDLGP